MHERFMQRAIELAQRGLWTTTPNPRVGCVITRDGAIIAEGWHAVAGGPHAEAHALQNLAQSGLNAQGATAYVTLEPCSHFGRTPPCADALIAAGITHVEVAMQDPNPLVAGRGIAKLAAAGISTSVGCLAAQAAELNPGFIARMQSQRPWLRLKTAASMDGKTALNNGLSQWITDSAARADGHRWRARACAILTGIGTVLHDDPQLTVRGLDTPRQPHRIVLDSQLRTPIHARILDTRQAPTTLLHTRTDVPVALREALCAQGAQLVQLPARAEGHVDLIAVTEWLNNQAFNEVHIEAGATLNGAFLAADLIDEWIHYQAPCVLGSQARGLFELPELVTLEAARRFQLRSLTHVGSDACFQLQRI